MAVVAAAAPESSPAAGAATRPHLPLSLSSLIGREREVDLACLAVCSDTAPLLTVTGPPGVGKTRLGVAVAWRLHHDFPNGVWFVDLAERPDDESLLTVVASVLGARGAPGD